MNFLRNPNSRFGRELVKLGVGFLALASLGCSSEPTMNEADITSFKSNVKSVAVGFGDWVKVPKIQDSMLNDYRNLPQTDIVEFFGGKAIEDLSLTFAPTRFNLGFTYGDGSGANRVCVTLDVPDGTQYVFATKDDTEQARVALDFEQQTFDICFEPGSGNFPPSVAAWASEVPR